MVLYPASSLHRVEPVTRGRRVASFFWIQSMVRDDSGRRILFDLDSSIQAIARDRGQDDPDIIRLTGVYHNLLRRLADSCDIKDIKATYGRHQLGQTSCRDRGCPTRYIK